MQRSGSIRWHSPRTCVRLLTSIALALCSSVTTVTAQDQETVLLLRPHCELEKQEDCPAFEINDPENLRTPELTVGGSLDVDLVLVNRSSEPIRRVRTWITYDPQILQGVTITVNEQFPIITPGEADFSSADGYAQIGVSTDAVSPVDGEIIPIARVQFTVLKAPGGGRTPLSFYDLQEGLEGHTFAVPAGNEESNILPTELGGLIVRIAGSTETSSSAASVSSASGTGTSVSSAALSSSTSQAAASTPASGASSSAASTGQRTAFILLQVQNLRATTEGSTIYVAWDPLASQDVRGYNIYYGSETGRYIQRKSIASTGNSISLRGLPEGTTYFVAIRAFNEAEEESAFSQEVSVKVGDPGSSTSPLVGQITRDDGPNGQNPLDTPDGRPITSTVPGESGASSILLLLLLGSAIIGTAFAFRRQLAAPYVRP
ncbi:MAG: fibronectin type III domain-containing protein [Candidatus Peregrinibacteria bacterium]|nr:fibronectin type III domain-containing protein [Candidatus Peregrinibacteria bacterium]